MKKILTTVMMAIAISTGCYAQTTNGGEATKANAVVKVYDESLNSMEQIDNALAKAKAEGKYVICQVGGNWCPWCLRFAKLITDDADLKAIVDKEFVYIHVNYPRRGANADAQAETMKRLGNPQRFGFPVMVVLNADGKVVHTQDSSYLEEGNGYNKEKVMNFFNHWTKSAVEQ